MGKLSGRLQWSPAAARAWDSATAKLFCEEGAKVIITGRDPATLDDAVRSIGHDVEAFRSDISNVADIEALRAHVEARYGHVDIVFANAGTARPGPFEQVSERHLRLRRRHQPQGHVLHGAEARATHERRRRRRPEYVHSKLEGLTRLHDLCRHQGGDPLACANADRGAVRQGHPRGTRWRRDSSIPTSSAKWA